MIDWPEDLVWDIAARRSVLFLGAGVSRNAENDQGIHPRDWTGFLAHMASLITNPAQREEVMQCIGDADLLTACELSRKYLSPSSFKTEMIKEFAGKGYKPRKYTMILAS